MAFPLLPVLLGAAVSGISAYGKYRSALANKPFEQKAIKQRAFKQRAQTGYLKRYMADLRGRSASRARTELAMRPALRAIGAQQQQGQRMLAYQSAQQGLTGSGIEAQKQLTLQQGTTQAVGGLGEKVLSQQLAQARQMQAQKEGQRMKLAGEIGRQESAVAEANRRSQFQTGEANRMAEERVQQANLASQQQYEQQKSAALTNVYTSVIGGGLSAGMPYAEKAYEAKLIRAEGGRVTKDGIAQYQYGGDVRAAVPGIVKEEEELYKQYQTEFDLATAEQEKRKRAREQEIKTFETAEAERQKQFDITEPERLKTYEEQAKLFKTGEGRRDVLGYQKETTKTLKKQGIVGEGGETIYGTKGLRGENVEGALAYIKTDPEEYNVLKEKADVLQKYSLGEKQLEKAKTQYETVKDNFESFEDYISQVTSDPNANVEDLFGESLSKREKKKLSKKYDKKTAALLNAQGIQVEEDKFEEPLTTRDPGEFVEQEFKPGVAPEAFAEKAPTLQEPTEKELRKIETREIYKQLVAGIDVRGDIAKAKGAREEMEFAKLLKDPNVDENALLATSFGRNNAFKAIKMIQDIRETKSDQFADYMKSVTTTNIVNATRSGDPNAISAVYDTPEYQHMLVNDPDKALSIFKTGNTAIDKITRTQATDLAKANKWVDHRNDLRYTLWGMDKLLIGDEIPAPGAEDVTGGKRILQIINDPANTEGITQAHLAVIEDILAEMRGKAEVQDIFNEKNSGEIDWKEAGVDMDWATFVSQAKFEKILKGLNNFVREEGVEKPPPFDLSQPQPPITQR